MCRLFSRLVDIIIYLRIPWLGDVQIIDLIQAQTCVTSTHILYTHHNIKTAWNFRRQDFNWWFYLTLIQKFGNFVIGSIKLEAFPRIVLGSIYSGKLTPSPTKAWRDCRRLFLLLNPIHWQIYIQHHPHPPFFKHIEWWLRFGIWHLTYVFSIPPGYFSVFSNSFFISFFFF